MLATSSNTINCRDHLQRCHPAVRLDTVYSESQIHRVANLIKFLLLQEETLLRVQLSLMVQLSILISEV